MDNLLQKSNKHLRLQVGKTPKRLIQPTLYKILRKAITIVPSTAFSRFKEQQRRIC